MPLSGREGGDEVLRSLQEHWRDEEVPLIDGIIRADGEVVLFSYEATVRGSDRGVIPSPKERSTLREQLAADPDVWTAIDVMCRADWRAGGLELHGGGGGFGSDGFVAATSLENGDLVWLVFSQWSNPFRSLAVEGAKLRAVTELGQVWELDLPTPTSISVAWS